LVKPDTLGAILTRHTAAALCLANRHPGVRAVLATDIPAAAAAVAAVGANLLVLDPTAGTFFQMKQILSDFCRGGVRDCPEVLKKRLG
jgi:ribose 5-phosphate isomerase RpiB